MRMKFFVKAFIIFCWANLSWASEPSFYNEVLELYNDGRYEEILARVDGHDDTKPLPPKIRFLKETQCCHSKNQMKALTNLRLLAIWLNIFHSQ